MVEQTNGWWVVVLVVVGIVAGGEAFAESNGADQAEKQKADEREKVDAREALNRANRLAGRGALTRSIPHYEKAIRHGYQQYPSAHFNLAGVLRAKENWDRAILHYGAYLNLGADAETKTKAERGVEKVKSRIWNKKLATLSVEVQPTAGATIFIDGMPVESGENLEGMTLLAGTYEVRVEVDAHKPETKTVKLGREDSKTLTFEPTKKTFFGTVEIEVDQEGAGIRLSPKSLDAPNAPDDAVERTSPVEESIRVATGKWLLEIEKKGYHRWVRHVQVERDETARVQVKLSEKLPEEIR